jgi:predicted phosphodiesterase
MVYRDSITGLCVDCLNKQRAAQKPDQLVAADREKQRMAFDLSTLKKKYAFSEQEVKRLERELHLTNEVNSLEVDPIVIEPKAPSGTAEGTIVLVASDWHVEERVDPKTVSFQNEYNLDIAKDRAEKFFRASLRLIRLLQQDIKVDTTILALLGDFISNDIHEEFPEVNALTPTHAIEFAQNLIVGGIEFLLNNSKLKFIIPCHSGNHARTTRTVRFATENGHSLEYLMYRNLANHFRGNERVEFRVNEGYHSYAEVYGKTLRFHHGHAINYQGGIGGIFIPAFKAISQWDKMRQADLDIFGHFHQHKDGAKFVSNGSLIGFNTYALSIKADFERPKQTLLLLDKQRGRTCIWPILFTK